MTQLELYGDDGFEAVDMFDGFERVDWFTDDEYPEGFDDFGFLGDIVDAVGDVVKGAADVVSSVWDRIPGSEHIDAATRALVDGPLKAFAQTGVGEFLLNAMAANLGGAAMFIGGPILGPALLISSAAIPGIAAGGDFGESLAKGWAWRLETAAQIAGPMVAAKFGNMVGDAANKAVEAARKAFPNVNPQQAFDLLAANGIDAKAELMKLPARGRRAAEEWAMEKARELGTTPAALLQAVDLNSGTDYFDINRWNLETGQLKAGVPMVDGSKGVIRSLGKAKAPVPQKVLGFGKRKANIQEVSPVSTICQQYEAMKAKVGAPPAIVEALRKKCEAEKASKAALLKGIKLPLAAAVSSPVARVASTIAAAGAVSQVEAAPPEEITPQGAALVQSAVKTDDHRSTKLGLIAGIAGAAVGAGGSMLAGLSAAIAAPVGIGFGLGAGIGTKLLTRKK